MTAEVYRSTTPCARRDHRCSECRRTIPVGVRYERVEQLCDGEWYSDALCPACSAALREASRRYAGEPDGLPPFGAIRDWLWEDGAIHRANDDDERTVLEVYCDYADGLLAALEEEP